MNELSEREFLAHYNIHDYDLPLVSVDLAIFSLDQQALHVLLVERGEPPFQGQWALPGGFIDPQRDYDLRATATRKLQEKTGIATPYLEQVESVGNAERDPRGWSVTVLYSALVVHTQTLPHVESVRDTRWVNFAEAENMPLAFDHSRLLNVARQRLKNKTAYSVLPMHVIATPFTLGDLQQAFECLMDTSLEKKSFRRRLLNADVLETVEAEATSSGRGRPAALFRPKAGSDQHQFLRVFGEG